jgi:hypothetical protein
MPSVLRSIAVFSFISAVALISAPGCSQQGEGERCDEAKNGDLDCDDGLVCVQASQLRDKTGDRCCPVSETDRTGLCTPSGVETETPDPGDGGTGAGGAAGAGAGGVPAAGGTSAGQSAGGAPPPGGSGTNRGVPSVDGGAPAAGATTGGAGSPSNSGGQGGAD